MDSAFDCSVSVCQSRIASLNNFVEEDFTPAVLVCIDVYFGVFCIVKHFSSGGVCSDL